MSLDLDDALATVRPLVVGQGRLAVERWSDAAPATYKNVRDFATAVDLEIEHNLKAELSKRFPGHGLSGEETGDEAAGDEAAAADYLWLIDPIDGTKFYAGHSSLFAVSVGLLHRGEPVLGVVYAAASGQCFQARRGGGAFLDDRRLQGPSDKDLSAAIVHADTPRTHVLDPDERRWFESRLVELTRRAYRVRALGIGSLAACWLATGALDAYVDLTGYVKPQDLAAGRVLLREAGLRVGFVDPGVGPPRFLAAPQGLRDQLARLLTA